MVVYKVRNEIQRGYCLYLVGTIGLISQTNYLQLMSNHAIKHIKC